MVEESMLCSEQGFGEGGSTLTLYQPLDISASLWLSAPHRGAALQEITNK